MKAPALLIAAIGLSLSAAACSSASESAIDDHDTHEHPELAEPAEGEQVYAIVDGRAGYQRVPLVDVSSVELIDYANSEGGEEFAPVAAPDEILLIFFGYLNCPDVCPTTLADYGAALGQVPEDIADRVAFGMVSVDAERDEGPEVAEYVGRFIDRRHGLVAADADRLATATESFGVRFGIEEHDPGSAVYEVAHASTVFAVDEAGEIIWEFTYQTPPEEIASALIDVFEERY